MAKDLVTSSARGTVFLILQQVASRAITFIFNQVLLRFLSPALLGTSVQLELYIISAHHFARESLRVACQRQPEGGIQAAINLSYLAIASGIPIVLGLAQCYLSTSYPDVSYFPEALRICGLAAIIELLSEPAFVAVQQNMMYKTMAAAQSSAVLLKTATTTGVVFWSKHAGMDLGALPFAIGELAHCSTLTVVYLWQTSSVARSQNFTLFPKKIEAKERRNDLILNLFPKSLFNLSLSLYVQQGIKYLLTQGDMLVSTALSTLEEQGTYALSVNYGGLIARMVFRPIEDSSRNLFAQLCAPTGNFNGRKSSSEKALAADKTTQLQANIKQAAITLSLVLRSYNIMSLLAFALGPTAAPLLLELVAGSQWSLSGAGEVSGVYCYCIPLLAINGVSEAFVAAAASTKELHLQSIWMGAFSAGFAGSAYLFIRVLEMGAKGLVWANCVNMALRIAFNLYFIKQYFRRHDLEYRVSDLLPNMYAAAGAVVVPGVLKQTKGMLAKYSLFGDLVRVGLVGAGLAALVAVTERRFLLDCWRRARS